MFGLGKKVGKETRACDNCGHIVRDYRTSQVKHYRDGRKGSSSYYCVNCTKPYSVVDGHEEYTFIKENTNVLRGWRTRYYIFTGVVAGQTQYKEVNEDGSTIELPTVPKTSRKSKDGGKRGRTTTK